MASHTDRVKSLFFILITNLFLICPAIAWGAENSQSSEGDGKGIELNDVVDVTGLANSWEDRLTAVLHQFGLTGSLAGKLLSSVLLFIVALIILIMIRLLVRKAFRSVAHLGEKVRISAGRLKVYQRFINFLLTLVLFVLFLVALSVIWSDSSSMLLYAGKFVGGLGEVFNFALVILFAVVTFEVINSLLESYFHRLARQGSSRVNTLLPIVRNVLYVAMALIFGLTITAELGIDIMPLLAGAGVLGFAVGFGAQTIIKDLITGIIIIFEDLVQVGDVVGLAGKTGVIERITIRKVQLRDLSGIVYTVPFSEIGIVENYTKEFSYYAMDMGIAYREDPDEAAELMKQTADEMREDKEFRTLMLDTIEILGVDAFGDSAVVIKARLKTLPGKQWQVGREYNRRIKKVFDAHNIEIPFPHQTIYFGEDKQGSAPPAHIALSGHAGDAAEE